MKLTSILPLLSLTTLSHSIPTQNEATAAIPYGAFPPPASPSPAPSPATTQQPPYSPSPSPDTHRLGLAVITNHCKIPIYIWSVGSTIRPEATILPYARYAETFRRDAGTGGIAIKISTARDGLYTSAPQTIFAYNVKGDKVWYDLSDVFGDPFKGHPVVLRPAEPEIYWRDGVPPKGSQVRVADAEKDLVLTLC